MTFAFALKKVIACALMPPGILILCCILIVLFARKRVKPMIILLAAFIYAVSINPTATALLAPLENAYKVPSVSEVKACDVYVVLGGGVNETAPTIDGRGSPDSDALARVTTAYRLYLISPKPIILSGGARPGSRPEAEIMKDYLLGLGVKEKYLIAETRSRDTYDNARYTAEICEKEHFKRVLLITSAYHMKRSVMLFGKWLGPVTPFPTGFKVDTSPRDAMYYLPNAASILNAGNALREYMGILFYKIRL